MSRISRSKPPVALPPAVPAARPKAPAGAKLAAQSGDGFEPKAGGDGQGQLLSATKQMQEGSKSAQEDVKAIMAGVK